MFEYNLPIPEESHPFPATKAQQSITNGPFVFENISYCPKKIKKRTNGWSDETQLKYLAFICLFKQQMNCLQTKQLWTYFKMLSLFIKCKNPNQCRIYHKQLLKQHHTIDAILSFYALPITFYSSTFKHYAEQITKMGEPNKIDDQQNKKQKCNKINSASSISINPSLTNKSIESTLQYDKKEELAPTGLAYQEELQPPRPIESGRYRSKGGMAFPNYSYIESIQKMENIGQDLPADKRQDWLQCHRLFLAWTTKLNSLLSTE